MVRGLDIDTPSLTSEDVENIKFAARNGFTYIAVSYVKKGEDLEKVREVIEKEKADMAVMAKIETVKGVENMEEIIPLSDAIIVARGDLGMQFPLEEVPKLQENIVLKSLKAGKPVIVATQILASMISNPTPTRAEVSDIAETVREGADGVMLTGETAVGKYPIETVKWLKKIIEACKDRVLRRREEHLGFSVKTKFAEGVVFLSESLNAKLAVYTRKGRTAFRISRFRPAIPFYAASSDVNVLRKLSIVWGVKPLKVEAENYMEGVNNTYKKLMQLGKLEKGETVVLTYGFIEEDEHIIKIVKAKTGFKSLKKT